MAFSPFLRQLALKVAQESFAGSAFYCIHARVGDYRKHWHGSSSVISEFVQTQSFRKWNKKLPLYLASDEPRAPMFNQLKSKMRTKTSADLSGSAIGEFRESLEGSPMLGDLFGVLEKLLCAQALGFIGSSYSTFSMDISHMRSFRNFVYPEFTK